MTRDQLLKKLIDIKQNTHGDLENDHADADNAILQYINDPEIEKAFDAIDKWYA